jgi:3-hydroxyisobutyrate dehydrogenase
MRVAVLGLGIIGSGMARNLVQKGFATTVWNRSPERAQPLVELGATLAASPREAAGDADLVLCVVGDDAASRAVWLGPDGALAGARPDTLAVDSSTLSLDWARELAATATGQGLRFLDAPLTGSKDAAQAGELVLFVGGAADDYEAALPVFEAISRRTAHLGPHGAGAVFKLVLNLMAAVQAVALAEGLTLAERAGLNMEQAVPLILNGAPGSPLVKGKAARMVARDYDDTHFALKWMRKDASYALRAAEAFGVPMPTVAAAREVYQLALNLGLGDLDFSAVAEAVRQGDAEA